MAAWLPPVLNLLGKLVKPLGFLFGFLWVKNQGSKDAVAKGNEEIIEGAKDALKDRNDIDNLDDESLTDIVFLHPKRGDKEPK